MCLNKDIYNGHTSVYICVWTKTYHVLFILKIREDSFKRKKRFLSEFNKSLEYLVILAWFFYFWLVSQDSFHLELQSRFFLRGKEKDSCLNLRKSWISCHSCLILLLLINQTRFLSSWISCKNLFSFLSKGILPEHHDSKESCLIIKKIKNLERTMARTSTSDKHVLSD
jgi:hypothetical protein